MVELFRFHLVVYLYYERSADFGHPDFKYFSKMDFFVSKEKKFFLFFTLTPSHLWLKRPVYRGFKCEGKCEGKFFALTPSHPLYSGRKALPV